MTLSEKSNRGLKIILKDKEAKSIEELFQNLYPQVNFETFFKKSLEEAWPKIGDIPDLDVAINILSKALEFKQKIAIVGDYDVDGSSATGLLISYFRLIGQEFIYYLPNRFTEGYGISTSIVQKLLEENIDIFITVDNGTTAYEAINLAKKHNKIFMVIDHHHPQEKIHADAFVNPHTKNSGYEMLCAAGVTFVLLVELNKYLQKNKQISIDIDMMNFIDIVAVATICDVVPMRGINRAIVAKGLEKINKNPLIGYKSILEDKIGKIDVPTIGFSLGPCINAPGRLDSAKRAVELIIETDEKEARAIAADLVRMNLERRDIEKKILTETELLVGDPAGKKSIVVMGEWFEGVIGIIAGRIKEKHQKPTCILSKNNGLCRGSLRSLPGCHIGNIINKAIEKKIALYGGGHEMAGGIALPEENLAAFCEFFEQEVSASNLEQIKTIEVDALLSLSSIENVYKIMEKFGPFGPSFPEPIFCFPNCIIAEKKHIKKNCLINLTSANFKNRTDMWLFTPEEKILQSFVAGNKINIIGQIIHGKNKLQIKLIDFFTPQNVYKTAQNDTNSN